MLETISKKIEAWVEVLGRIIFGPRQFFSSSPNVRKITASEFFIGNILASYIVTFTGSLGYFFVYYRPYLVAHVKEQAVANLTVASALFLAYVLLNFVLLLVPAAISYVVINLFGSSASFSEHFRIYLYLTALEPLAALSMTLSILALNRETPILLWAVGLFTLTRAWYLLVGFWAIRRIHKLSPIRHWLAFILGYVPSLIFLNFLIQIVVLLILGIFIVPGWD